MTADRPRTNLLLGLIYFIMGPTFIELWVFRYCGFYRAVGPYPFWLKCFPFLCSALCCNHHGRPWASGRPRPSSVIAERLGVARCLTAEDHKWQSASVWCLEALSADADMTGPEVHERVTGLCREGSYSPVTEAAVKMALSRGVKVGTLSNNGGKYRVLPRAAF